MTPPARPERRPLEAVPDELSGNERIKAASRQLRGTIAEELRTGAARFTEPNAVVLKFHGVYQQDDRDLRKQARAQGLDKHYQMMVRTRVPGGVVSAAGYLAHDEIAERWGNGTLRITTRQDFQTHGVLKGDLHATIAAINRGLLTTLGGCGDQERNVLCCPAPSADALHGEALATVHRLAAALKPATGAYAEIWLDGEQAATLEAQRAWEVDPLYGQTYLPRKFKTAVALEGDNCVDVYANDLGLVAMRGDGGGVRGYTVLVGGGLGQTNNKPETFPAVAQPVGYVDAADAVDAARAVVSMHRDFGDRRDRRHARLKYVIADRGLDWFRERLQERLGGRLQDAPELRWRGMEDHLGWHEQGDGLLFCGIHVENGRVLDSGSRRMRTGLRTLVAELGCEVRLTPQQNIILCGIRPTERSHVEARMREHGIAPVELIPLAVRHAMACPAYPTCGLAVAEAERVSPRLVREIDAIVQRLGLQDEPISYRMTGCPNGCARPYIGDVGVVGTTLGKYDLYLGGDTEGTRLNRLYAHNVPLDAIAPALEPLLTAFAGERLLGEGFGDWAARFSVETLRSRFLSGGAAVAPQAAVDLVGGRERRTNGSRAPGGAEAPAGAETLEPVAIA